MFCQNCGKEIKSEAKFCPYCGANQEEALSDTPQNIGSIEDNQEEKGQAVKKTPMVLAGVVVVVCIAAVVAVLCLTNRNKAGKTELVSNDVASETDNSEVVTLENSTEEMSYDISYSTEDISYETEDALEEYMSEPEVAETIYEYEIEETVSPLDNLDNSSLQMTADEIEQERLRIKDVIAAGNVEQYILPVGTNGVNWARQLDYEDGKLIFAYYYNSASGDSDQRFYFKDGVMLRWVVGTSPNQIYYNISDDTLPDGWYAYEAECLNVVIE
jgi:hypothetical protein